MKKITKRLVALALTGSLVFTMNGVTVCTMYAQEMKEEALADAPQEGALQEGDDASFEAVLDSEAMEVNAVEDALPEVVEDEDESCGDIPGTGELTLIKAGGYLESLYAEVTGKTASEIKSVYWYPSSRGDENSLSDDDLKFLVRDVEGGKVRIDIPGVPAGSYTLCVSDHCNTLVCENITVEAFDRSGYAHFNSNSGVGAYNNDGSLKTGAVVIYVTDANKNTVKLSFDTNDDTARVLYPGDTDFDSVAAGTKNGVITVVGIGNILNSAATTEYLAEGGSSGNVNKGIMKMLADANIPIDIRFMGIVSDSGLYTKATVENPFNNSKYGKIDGLTAFSAVEAMYKMYNGDIDVLSTYASQDFDEADTGRKRLGAKNTVCGGTAGDNGHMAKIKETKDLTIEGIGTDATIDGWGFSFGQFNSSDDGLGRSFEVRNLKFINTAEDAIGMEGKQSGDNVSTAQLYPVQRCWVHNNEFYCPHLKFSADADSRKGSDDPESSGFYGDADSGYYYDKTLAGGKAFIDANKMKNADKYEGDGSVDFKRGRYFTCSYNYFEGCHKTNLIGADNKNLQFDLTFHHNYWMGCQSRGPLARLSNIHMYNNIVDYQSDYAQSANANGLIFSEYNIFYGAKSPQKTGDGGVIKSYNDSFAGIEGSADGEVITSRNDAVISAASYSAANVDFHDFVTSSDKSYIPGGSYGLSTDLLYLRKLITARCGVMQEDPVATGDIDAIASDRYSVITGDAQTLTPGSHTLGTKDKNEYAIRMTIPSTITWNNTDVILVNEAGANVYSGNGSPSGRLAPGTYMLMRYIKGKKITADMEVEIAADNVATCSLTFDYNYPEAPSALVAEGVYVGTEYSSPESMIPSGFKRTGNVLLGLYTDSSCSAASKVAFPYTVKGNETFYANWVVPRKIDVWDFGGKQESDTDKYDNHIDVDDLTAIVNGNSNGSFVTNGEIAIDDLTFCVDGDYLYTTENELRDYTYSNDSFDPRINDFGDGYTSTGGWMTNGSGSENARYITVRAGAGDVLRFYCGFYQVNGSMNSGIGRFVLKGLTGEALSAEPAEYDSVCAAYSRLDYVADKSGFYKLYVPDDKDSNNCKPFYFRVVRIPAVEVSGSITGYDSLPEGWGLKFVSRSDADREYTATVTDGVYTVSLPACDKYIATLTGAGNIGITASTKNIDAGEDSVALGIVRELQVESRDSHTLTGTISGYEAGSCIMPLKIEFLPVDQQEEKVTATISGNTFTAKLKEGVEYNRVVGGAKDYTFTGDNKFTLYSDATTELSFTKNATYTAGGRLTGLTDIYGSYDNILLDGAKLTFSRVVDGYMYACTTDPEGRFNIELCDGVYQASIDSAKYSTTTHLTVDGSNVNRDILLKDEDPSSLPYSAEINVGSEREYRSVHAAVDAVKRMSRTGSQRVTIKIDPGVYREQVVVETPNITLESNGGSRANTKITWYYGYGYKYYSSDADSLYDPYAAYDRYSKNQVNKYWGGTVILKRNADGFRAKGITFENSFNKYITDAETDDGVEPVSDSFAVRDASLSADRKTDESNITVTERAAAFVNREGFDKVEFLSCSFISSQDTLYTANKPSSNSYYKDCYIEGQTDFICGDGDVIFDNCELNFCGYSDYSVPGWLTAHSGGNNSQAKPTDGYIFRNCHVTYSSKRYTTPGYWGRMWGGYATVAFINTVLEDGSMILPAGWDDMSPNKVSDDTNDLLVYNTSCENGQIDSSGWKGNTSTINETDYTVENVFEKVHSWTPAYYNEDPVIDEKPDSSSSSSHSSSSSSSDSSSSSKSSSSSSSSTGSSTSSRTSSSSGKVSPGSSSSSSSSKSSSSSSSSTGSSRTSSSSGKVSPGSSSSSSSSKSSSSSSDSSGSSSGKVSPGSSSSSSSSKSSSSSSSSTGSSTSSRTSSSSGKVSPGSSSSSSSSKSGGSTSSSPDSSTSSKTESSSSSSTDSSTSSKTESSSSSTDSSSSRKTESGSSSSYDSSSSSKTDSSSSSSDSSSSRKTESSSSSTEGSSSSKSGDSSSSNTGSSSSSKSDSSSSSKTESSSSSSDNSSSSKTENSSSISSDSSSSSKTDSSSSSKSDSSSSSDAKPVVQPIADEKLASSQDNIAPLAPNQKANDLVVDFTRVESSGVAKDQLAMTVISGAKITTAGEVASVQTDNGIKFKIDKKTNKAKITAKKSGYVTFTMADGSVYRVYIKAEKPKAKKIPQMNAGADSAPVTYNIEQLFGTTLDGGTLEITKSSGTAVLNESKTEVTITPREKDTVKLTYRYMNKKYKNTIKILRTKWTGF